MTRRQSIKQLVLTVSALTAPSFLQAKSGLSSVGLKLAVQQYSFNRQLRDGSLDILDYPKAVVEGTGIKALEYFNGHIEDKENNTAFFKELRKRCDDLGAINTLMLCRSNAAVDSPDPSIRDQAIEGYKPWLEATRILGGNTIRVDCREPGDFEEQKNNAVAGLRKLCKVADGFGMNIVVENHGNHSNNGKWLADVLKRVDLPNCGSLPDFQNFKEYDPYQGLRDLMPFAKVVCAKSKAFDRNGNESNVDYKRLMKIVLDSGFKGYIGIEFEGHEISPIEGILATKLLIENVVSDLIG